MTKRWASPLPWLGGLLAIYLIAPLAGFLVRLGRGAPGVPGLGGALATSVITASISTVIIALLGIPLAYGLARARGPVGNALSVMSRALSGTDSIGTGCPRLLKVHSALAFTVIGIFLSVL